MLSDSHRISSSKLNYLDFHFMLVTHDKSDKIIQGHLKSSLPEKVTRSRQWPLKIDKIV